MANNNTNNKNENGKKKIDRKVLFTRILCLVLAGLMVSGGVFVIINALV